MSHSHLAKKKKDVTQSIFTHKCKFEAAENRYQNRIPLPGAFRDFATIKVLSKHKAITCYEKCKI